MANEYVTSAELKATLTLTGETFADADIDRALESASRAIDDVCGARRRFYKDGSDQTRYYTPSGRRLVVIDDLADFTTLHTDEDGDGVFETAWTENTMFVFEPLNAELDGQPRQLIRAVNWEIFPAAARSVRVVGKFGWDATPPAIKTATTILATILLKRMREAPFGIVNLGVDTAARIARFDPQVSMLLDPYRRLV